MTDKFHKARRLVETGRCHVIACEPDRFWIGSVEGSNDSYLVTFVKNDVLVETLFEEGIPTPVNTSCTCEHSKHAKSPCSHIIAAGALLEQASGVAS